MSFKGTLVPWVGGKSRLAAWITSHFPQEFNQYHEPFFGGGAVFFRTTLLQQHTCYLSDYSRELVQFWQTVRDQPAALHSALMRHAQLTTKEYFFVQRDLHNTLDLVGNPECDDVERAARFSYLLRACYKGLYDINSEGKTTCRVGIQAEQDQYIYVKAKRPGSNEPRGWERRALYIPSADKFVAASRLLQNAVLRHGCYTQCEPQAGDIVYLDPPYHSSQQGYVADPFGDQQQTELHQKACEWRDIGVHVFVSHRNTEFIRDLWSDWQHSTKHHHYYLGHKSNRYDMLFKSWKDTT